MDISEIQICGDTMIYALIVIWFIHGVPPKVDGVMVGVFDRPEYCCQALDNIERRTSVRSIAFCAKKDQMAPDETAVVFDCGEPL